MDAVDVDGGWFEDAFLTQSREEAKTQKEEFEKPENVLSRSIVDSAIEVHRTLGGPGLLESVYKSRMDQELGWTPSIMLETGLKSLF
jgi:hypothetical protein